MLLTSLFAALQNQPDQGTPHSVIAILFPEIGQALIKCMRPSVLIVSAPAPVPYSRLWLWQCL